MTRIYPGCMSQRIWPLMSQAGPHWTPFIPGSSFLNEQVAVSFLILFYPPTQCIWNAVPRSLGYIPQYSPPSNLYVETRHLAKPRYHRLAVSLLQEFPVSASPTLGFLEGCHSCPALYCGHWGSELRPSQVLAQSVIHWQSQLHFLLVI